MKSTLFNVDVMPYLAHNMGNMYNRVGVGLAILILILATPTFAQISDEERRREELERTLELQSTEDFDFSGSGEPGLLNSLSTRSGWGFKYGGSMAPSYTGGSNNDRDDSTVDSQDHTWEYDLRYFFIAQDKSKKKKFYARAKTSYTETKKSSATISGNNFNNPKIDMMYYQQKFKNKGFRSTMTAGRHLVRVGRGIAFSKTADGLSWESKQKKNTFKTFLVRRQSGDNQFDSLAPGGGHTKRTFYGAEWKYNMSKKAKFHVFGVHSNDRNTNQGDTATQSNGYGFDPTYYGVGVEGKATKKLKYWGEYIIGRGTTANDTAHTARFSDVKSNALDVGLRYFFGGALSPTLYGEFMYGSGDEDRDTGGNATSARNGNKLGNDKAFRPFGGIGLGSALSPTLNNIKVYKVGTSIKPFGRSSNRLINDMTFNLIYYSFKKDKALGIISDSKANQNSKDLGNEIDFQISWKQYSDLKHQLKLGQFKPGNAYSQGGIIVRDKETYIRYKVSVDL